MKFKSVSLVRLGVIAPFLLFFSVAHSSGPLPGLYVQVPDGFTVIESKESFELRSTASFCSVQWREVLRTSQDQVAANSSLDTDDNSAPAARVVSGSYSAAGVEYATWQRAIPGPVTSIEGVATCPAWSAAGMEPIVVGILESAQLNRSPIEQAFAGLPFIAEPPEGFAVSRRFANSLVLAAQNATIPNGTSISISSLQIRRADIPFSELSRTLLSNQQSLTDVVVTSQRNIFINGFRGHHLLASGISADKPTRIHQVVLGDAAQLTLITLTAPVLDDSKRGAWSLASEEALLVELMTSLRLKS